MLESRYGMLLYQRPGGALQGYLHNKSVPGFGALGVFGVGQSLARLGNPRENLGGASKRALWASSEALCRSSGACCASHGPFGSVLGSIRGSSRHQNLLSLSLKLLLLDYEHDYFYYYDYYY